MTVAGYILNEERPEPIADSSLSNLVERLEAEPDAHTLSQDVVPLPNPHHNTSHPERSDNGSALSGMAATVGVCIGSRRGESGNAAHITQSRVGLRPAYKATVGILSLLTGVLAVAGFSPSSINKLTRKLL